MQGYNCIIVYSPDTQNILFCKREKEPYLGLYNLVGGKIEPNENGIDAAYRELSEETGITRADITLTHVMTFTYPLQDCYVEVYGGRLKATLSLVREAHELTWLPADGEYFDMRKYAGEGNIGHMIEQVKMYRDTILGRL